MSRQQWVRDCSSCGQRVALAKHQRTFFFFGKLISHASEKQILKRELVAPLSESGAHTRGLGRSHFMCFFRFKNQWRFVSFRGTSLDLCTATYQNRHSLRLVLGCVWTLRAVDTE